MEMALPVLAVIWRRSVDALALKFNKSNDAAIEPKARKSIQSGIAIELWAYVCVCVKVIKQSKAKHTNYDV